MKNWLCECWRVFDYIEGGLLNASWGDNGDMVSYIYTGCHQKSECDLSGPLRHDAGLMRGPIENICGSVDRAVKSALFRVDCM